MQNSNSTRGVSKKGWENGDLFHFFGGHICLSEDVMDGIERSVMRKKVFLITLQLVIQTLSSKAKLSIENFKACPYADILAFGIVVI